MDLEAAQAIMCILLTGSLKAAPLSGEIGGKSVGIGRVDIGVPPRRGMTPGIGQRRRVLVHSLDEELRTVAANDGKEWILIRLLKRYLKSKLCRSKRRWFDRHR